MSNKRFTAIDFDGTVTDTDKEAIPYLEGYKNDIAAHLSFSRGELDAIWMPVEAEVLAAPEHFGWLDAGGRIIAPTTADPMILARTVATQIFRRLLTSPGGLGVAPSQSLTRALPQNDTELHDLLQHKFFEGNYAKMETHFRPGAADFLASLSDMGRLAVITNSRETGVRAKLAKLREANPALPDIDVIGGAEKYTLTPEFVVDGVAAVLHCSPHLVRPVFTQRGKYYEALRKSGIFDAESRVVAGDVWELDLMLPLLLDMKVAFITRPMTPVHEIAIVRHEVGRGMAVIADNLAELLFGIRELHETPMCDADALF